MDSLAVAIHKGGSGKTSVSVSVLQAHASLLKTYPHLVPKTFHNTVSLAVDLDPQANMTESLGIDPPELQITNLDFIREPEKTVEFVTKKYGLVQTIFDNIYCIASSIELEEYTDSLSKELDRADRVVQVLTQLKSPEVTDFLKKPIGFVVIDTPPSLGIYTQNALVASDHILVPMMLNKHAMLGLTNFQRLVSKTRRYMKSERKPSVIGYVLVAYDRRVNLHLTLETTLKQLLFDQLFENNIPTRAKFVENISRRRSIFYQTKNTDKEIIYTFLQELYFRMGYYTREEYEKKLTEVKELFSIAEGQDSGDDTDD